jgi:hypothetical protein
MAYLTTNTTLEMSMMMMMMVTIKLITCFKYHTIPMNGKSELLVFIVKDHGRFKFWTHYSQTEGAPPTPIR